MADVADIVDDAAVMDVTDTAAAPTFRGCHERLTCLVSTPAISARVLSANKNLSLAFDGKTGVFTPPPPGLFPVRS